MENEPLCKGGQGRSSGDVESDGRICGWLILAAIGIGVLCGLAVVASRLV